MPVSRLPVFIIAYLWQPPLLWLDICRRLRPKLRVRPHWAVAAGAAASLVAALAARLVERAAAELPKDVSAEVDGEDVVLRGRGLWRRLGFDSRLRDIGRGGQ